MIEIQILYPHTVEPRFNEVPRDWGNLFVISKGSLYRTPPFNEFSGNYQNVRYTAEKLIFNLQNPSFPGLKNSCNNISIYLGTAQETQEQANKTA